MESLLQVIWGEFTLMKSSAFDYSLIAATLVLLVFAIQAIRTTPVTQPPGNGNHLALALSVGWAVSAWLGITLISGLYRDISESKRYYAIGAGGAALLLAWTLVSLPRARLRCTCIGIALALEIAISTRWLFYRGEQVREAVRFVATHRHPDEPVIMCRDSGAQLIAQYYTLGTDPLLLDENIWDPAEIESFLQKAVGGSPSFWLVSYKEKGHPLAKFLPAWVTGKYELAEKKDFHEASAKKFKIMGR